MVLLRMRQSKVRSSLLASFTTKQTNDQGTKMKPIKIQITPEVREFNEQVEHCDFLTDYQFDQGSAETLLDRLNQARCYPASAQALRQAMANLAIKQ